jgi:putative hemolysin
MTSFQHSGSAAVEGEISYEPIEGGKRVKSNAIISFVGRPLPVEKILEQTWPSEAVLAKANLENCAASGGTRENVTVKAGTFEACKIHSATPEIEITKWTGKVPPTGLLRMDLKKKEVQTREELTDYLP